MENVIKKTRKALKPVEPFEPLRSIMKSRARAKARILPPPQCVGVPMIFSAFGASRLPSAMMSRPAKRHRSHRSHRSLAMEFLLVPGLGRRSNRRWR